MARRVQGRKRNHLGNRSYGGGNTKNRRGKGNKGGKGRAGWHKHKWLKTIKAGEHLIRKLGFRSTDPKPKTLTLLQLVTMAQLGSLEKSGTGFKASLPGRKVVFSPIALTSAFDVSADSFTKKAKAVIEKAGGKTTDLVEKKPPKAPKPADGAPAQAKRKGK